MTSPWSEARSRIRQVEREPHLVPDVSGLQIERAHAAEVLVVGQDDPHPPTSEP